MREQVELWQGSEWRGVAAKVVIYEGLPRTDWKLPSTSSGSMHDLYFEPKHEEFRPRARWSLHGLVIASTGDSSGTDFNRLRAATGRANGIGLSLL